MSEMLTEGTGRDSFQGKQQFLPLSFFFFFYKVTIASVLTRNSVLHLHLPSRRVLHAPDHFADSDTRGKLFQCRGHFCPNGSVSCMHFLKD